MVFRHDMFMLEFDGSTTIRKVSANGVGFVRYTFQLVDFDDIELTNNKYMIDVSSYVTNVRRTSHTKSGSKTLDFYLANQRGQSLRVTLWGGVGDSLIEKKTAHVGMCTIVLTSMTVKTYNSKDICTLIGIYNLHHSIELKSVTTQYAIVYVSFCNKNMLTISINVYDNLAKPKKEMMMADSSQPREGTIENLLLWAKNRKNNAMTFQCKVMIEDIRRKSGWNYPSCGGEKCRKSVSCKAGKFLCKTCNRNVDYPCRLEVVVADDTAQTVSAEDNSGLPTAIRNLIGTTHVMELKSHTYYESELEDSDTDEVLCSAKDPHEINADGPVNKKKRKMRIDEDSDSV
ncbi:54S ribosomal protein L19, mitochondrial [Tanacetum coccineum]